MGGKFWELQLLAMSEHLPRLSVTIAFARFGRNFVMETLFCASLFQRTVFSVNRFLVDLMNLFQLLGLYTFEMYEIHSLFYFELYREDGEDNFPADQHQRYGLYIF